MTEKIIYAEDELGMVLKDSGIVLSKVGVRCDGLNDLFDHVLKTRGNVRVVEHQDYFSVRAIIPVATIYTSDKK
jgi:hypothetical protein